MNFQIGEKIVYPNHGIGTIENISTRSFGAQFERFYLLRLTYNSMTVMVPFSHVEDVGLRKVTKNGEVAKVLSFLAEGVCRWKGDWKDRFKEFSEKMRTGDIFEAADVLKHLTYLSHLKPLSFREQRMLERSRYLVVSELAAVCRQPECNIEPRVDEAIAKACAKHDKRPSRARVAAAAAGH